MIADVRKPAGLLAIVAAFAVLSAGCIVQDRPHESRFFVVADAGENQVLAVGETAHFEWAENRTVKVEEGEPPHVDVEYSWKVGDVEASVNDSLAVARGLPEFVLVELNVTAKEHTASDAVGVLIVPPSQDASRRLYVATVGFIQPFLPVIGLDVFTATPVSGAQTGSWWSGPLGTATGPVRVPIFEQEPQFPPEPVRGSILFAVKDGPGAARGVATSPLEFDAENTYALWIDPTPAAHDMIEVRSAEGTLISNTTLEAFETAHAAGEEVEVPVGDAQTLPGFEGLAAVATMFVLGAVLVGARRRR